MPTNTPVRLPVSVSGAIPARSNASHATSSSSRCCGSMLAASRGEILKNSGSKPAMSSRNPPHRLAILPGASGSAS
jgi:hypothetical protein